MNKDLLNQFGWMVEAFDHDRDGEINDEEVMFANFYHKEKINGIN